MDLNNTLCEIGGCNNGYLEISVRNVSASIKYMLSLPWVSESAEPIGC